MRPSASGKNPPVSLFILRVSLFNAFHLSLSCKRRPLLSAFPSNVLISYVKISTVSLSLNPPFSPSHDPNRISSFSRAFPAAPVFFLLPQTNFSSLSNPYAFLIPPPQPAPLPTPPPLAPSRSRAFYVILSVYFKFAGYVSFIAPVFFLSGVDSRTRI